MFVAHSMGGLVARYYVECMEGWKLTRSLVTFGTPFRGSGNALGFLANGFVWKSGPFSLFDGTEALRSFDSVYQLLPIYPFVNDGSKLVRPAEIDIPNLDRERASAALGFHDEMTKAYELNRELDAYRSAGTKIRAVVGVDQPTAQSATITADMVETSTMYEGEEISGDGTVPRVSAFPIGYQESGVTYISATHSALQSVANALEHLRGVLTATQIDFDKFRADPIGPGSISLDLPDAFDGTAPAAFRLRTSANVQAVSGLVERLDGTPRQWRPTLMRVGPNEYAGELALPAGLYRFSASPTNFRPASDIFLVAGAYANS
ncbi:esterase/lipase family protein [Bosea massiliensis]|uniref:Lipase family alpha/beta hydrolase n=1 Tax=Bosea massiliensis TaxID=151419 RepID=A0ABW0PCQ5_9HYPH